MFNQLSRTKQDEVPKTHRSIIKTRMIRRQSKVGDKVKILLYLHNYIKILGKLMYQLSLLSR